MVYRFWVRDLRVEKCGGLVRGMALGGSRTSVVAVEICSELNGLLI